MDRGPAGSVLREIRTLYTLGTLGGLTDAQLLERFLARGGDDAEDAFAALVHRHGPTVLGVCRRMLPRLARCRGRLPGDVPRPGATGRVDRPAGATGELALRRRGPDRQGGPAPGRAQRAIERRMMDVPGSSRNSRGPGRSAPAPGRGAESPAGALSGGPGGLRAGGEIAARGRPAARHPRGHALHPPGAGTEAAPRAVAPARGHSRRRADRRVVAARSSNPRSPSG